MSTNPRTPVGHNRYTLQVDKLDTHLDVLAFEGHEYLSQPYLYSIEFTASDLDIGAEKFIGQYAEFSLFDDPATRLVIPWEEPKPPVPLRTLYGRITHPETRPLYTEIDKHGRYRVKFLFDRDTWPAGRESKWLRQARAYAGDTYGLHMPLIAGTEVAIAFEQGDTDKPYIAHALHDDQHPDLVSSRYQHRNDHRNVLRTPANNKLRLDDTRGQEHIKLSTEYGGKSQLNLGHLVDGKRVKRGEGFELRTDEWGAIRGGKGVFISADAQAKAQGPVLDMDAAVARL